MTKFFAANFPGGISTSMKATIRPFVAVSSLSGVWLVGVLASWFLVALMSAITVPLKYPYEAYGNIVDSGSIIGLVLPIAVLARILDEGPIPLVAGASRDLRWVRALRAVTFVILCALSVYALSPVVPASTGLLVADTVLLAALAVLSVVSGGPGVAWFGPLVGAGLFSTPGLVPWELNILYRGDQAKVALLLAALAASLGIVVYVLHGSAALIRHRRLRQADQDLTLP